MNLRSRIRSWISNRLVSVQAVVSVLAWGSFCGAAELKTIKTIVLMEG